MKGRETMKEENAAFDDMTRDLVERTTAPVQTALNDAKSEAKGS